MTSAHRLLVGVRNGVIATVPMSVVMGAAALVGTLRPLPPRQITQQLLPPASERIVDGAALLSHTTYGAAAGVAYELIFRTRRAGPLSGALYGAALWVLGYEVWVPIGGLLPPAHRDRLGRTLPMLAAHIVFGSVLGALPRGRSD